MTWREEHIQRRRRTLVRVWSVVVFVVVLYAATVGIAATTFDHDYAAATIIFGALPLFFLLFGAGIASAHTLEDCIAFGCDMRQDF